MRTSPRIVRFAAWGPALAIALSSCGGAPPPGPDAAADEQTPKLARRRDLLDDCAVVPGKPAPEPLAKIYEGVAAKARCQREVFTIMGGLTHFLGVQCQYCHAGEDYPAPTHRKSIANWMARELIPSLEKKGGGEVWCNDCHVVNGKGTAKILGNPRKQAWAIEWMTAHLSDDFQRATDDGTLRCKDCHGANLGSPDFKRKIVLTDNLPPRPPRPQPEPAQPPEPTPDAGAGSSESDAAPAAAANTAH